ncbi:D-alanyl-D-alanine carboxypeptidase/D-alanyl-D-alanine-endopeptidase [Alkalinema sp. FACHB-956]|uniref:D-alanyl-D-alanine carboxypeptidase/D-alanyl-D-alanine endopeptidase n=1 Tax=Alkalinema sp. FACHB-956 TaxID=2692768 RepID=UPI001683DEB0|nr:D-alanyl-D-alanine carboxypeptidase/D-alanyl-D-alanine-endopeptidase [Alkalinema sp. FACHB-956]MBD2329084.1 D-alanyl-D-alanine carboxypeptidase/D-alanyl-D-alanine-endopeptidase [Alkalinema sp. FACHB-956]
MFNPAPAIAQVCPVQLDSQVKSVLGRIPNGRWGILVQTQAPAGQRRNLVNLNASTQLIPASNAKILTTAAALHRLGADYRIQTIATGNAIGPNLATLRIMGQGDPSLTTQQLSALVTQLQQKGIRQVDRLIGDETYFQGPTINPNWDAEDIGEAYAVATNALILNQNAINLTLFPQKVGQPLQVQWEDITDRSDWTLVNRSKTVGANAGEFANAYRKGSSIVIDAALRVGSDSEWVGIAIPNPGNYLVRKFRNLLTQAGIQVKSSTLVQRKMAPPGEVTLATVSSPPLSELLYETNQESNNTYAEALLKTLGKQSHASSRTISGNATQDGIAAVKTSLTALGVNANRYSLVDGSGLARGNRVSPEALVQTLQAIAQLPTAEIYKRSLPMAGMTGTLKNRFRGTPAQGVVLAKTGTISGAVSLSGYITPKNHPPLVFSILVNSAAAPATVRQAIDDVVVQLSQLTTCDR